MRVNPIKDKPLNFKGADKFFLKGLEKISDHGASFAAGVSFISAVMLRPCAISLTPKADKENKKYASANSIASGLMKLAIVEAVALPVEAAIKNIDKNPSKFLKKETIENLQNGAETLLKSRDYKFATQSIKMGSSLLSAIPKSILTVALIPLIMDKILNNKKEEKTRKEENKYDDIFSPVYNKLAFKGNIADKTAKGIGKILNLDFVQNFSKKHSANEANIARNMAVATDVLLTGMSSFQILKSKKIKEENKKPLVYNNLIGTGISVTGGVIIDKLIQKAGKNSLEKFKQSHINDPKLSKYVEGINILRPTLIFALIYYGILPVVSTFFADKIDKKLNNKATTAQE